MLLDVRQLCYTYPDGQAALVDVGFQLAHGERVGLIGPNGAGKSTLLWHLNGLLPDRLPNDPNPPPREIQGRAGQGRAGRESTAAGAGQGGGVAVEGLPLCERNLAEVRRRVGLVFQDPDDQLFCPTVWEDVAYGPVNLRLPAAEVDARVREALLAVGLPADDQRVPHHLSVGERKRACLAGVLACRPMLLALDEPTANLDPRGRRQLLDVLQRLDCALLVASHDLDLISRLATRVLLLDGGRLCADGPTAEILADTALLEAHGLVCDLFRASG